MKFSDHFVNDVFPKRPYLTKEVIGDILANPLKIDIQNDGRKKIWGFSSEYSRHIRVAPLEDNETILTAFFDRNFNPSTK